jgi:glycine cleavage system H protein
MSEIPDDLRYTESHEWLRDRGDRVLEMGVTDHAQDALGELVYVEMPEVGDHVDAGETCATVESVKSASDVYSPFAGDIVETNGALGDDPGKVNEAPYEGGWLVRIRVDESDALDGFMDAAAYREFCEQSDE